MEIMNRNINYDLLGTPETSFNGLRTLMARNVRKSIPKSMSSSAYRVINLQVG